MSDNTAKTYCRKPLCVDAMLFDGTSDDLMAVFQWVEANTKGYFDPFSPTLSGSGVSIHPDGSLMLSTLEGVKIVKKGMWVVKVSDGQFTTASHESFAAEYQTQDGSEMPVPQPVEEPTPPPVEDPVSDAGVGTTDEEPQA